MSWCGRISQGWRQRYERDTKWICSVKYWRLSQINAALRDRSGLTCCKECNVWEQQLLDIINQTTTVKQELRADITSKHLRREAIQIDEVWSQFKRADIPDRSQMHEWKDCEIWSFQRYVCVCCDMNANVVPPDPLTEGERSDGEQRRRRWCICVCLYQAPVHTQALRKHWQTLITSIIQFHGNAILSLIPFLRFSLKKNHTNKTFWTAFLIPNVNSHTL